MTMEECILRKRSELSIEWVKERLVMGCPCDNLSIWNQGRLQLYCEPFPFIHEASTQFLYNLIFALFILFAVAGNLTVVW